MAETDEPIPTPGPAPARDHGFWDQVEEAFNAVLAAGDTARTDALVRHCGASTEVQAEVEALLAAHVRAGEFITPATHSGSLRPDDALADDTTSPPGQVGAFRLHECIGEGGMGAVYRAERVEGDFVQRVAVKLISSRLYGADTLRRFRAERQILASLQHPNIVALLDGGVTAAGHPYIAMEYVEGLPISAYCQQHELALAARLRLFRQLCGAVSFAHRHLVVHRDLKPANVLVTADATVKVLDFGVAKLLDASGAATEATGVLLGPLTPDFASPEQIKGAPLTTASDVYALGVMLYELLTASRPYTTAGKPLDEVMALVLHHEPARPSAARGGDVPYELQALRGDLDAIVLRAMAKDADRRYASAEDLATEIERYLDGLPVTARPRALRYLAGKLVKRHKAAFTVATVFLALLVGALGAALWQARVAARERERAVRRFNDVRQLTGAMIFKLHDEIAPLAGSTPARRTVIAEGLKFLEVLQQDAAGDPALQVELARAYLRIGDVLGGGADANLGDRQGARDADLKALALLRPLAQAPEMSDDVTQAWGEANLAFARAGGPREPTAEALRTALATAQAWHTRAPSDERAQTLLARAHMRQAFHIGPPDAAPHWHQAERLSDALLAKTPDDPARQREVALIQKYFGGYYDELNDLGSALPHYRRAYELDSKRLQSEPNNRRIQLDVAIDLGNVADVQRATGDHAQALSGYLQSLEIRQRLSAADPGDVHTRARVAFMHNQVANTYYLTGRLGQARTHVARALALYDGLNHGLEYGEAFMTLANIERAEHHGAAACAALVRAQQVIAQEAPRSRPNASIPKKAKAQFDAWCPAR